MSTLNISSLAGRKSGRPSFQVPIPANRPRDARERYWAALILTRSKQLTSTDKLVLRLVIDLDRPIGRRMGGAFASTAGLAERLGVTARTVERTRPKLRHLGLIHRHRDAKGRWRLFVSLPTGVELRPATGLAGAPLNNWLGQQTSTLDDALARRADRGSRALDRQEWRSPTDGSGDYLPTRVVIAPSQPRVLSVG